MPKVIIESDFSGKNKSHSADTNLSVFCGSIETPAGTESPSFPGRHHLMRGQAYHSLETNGYGWMPMVSGKCE